MNHQSPHDEEQPNKIPSGTEIVAHFIGVIELDPSLDQATIKAIKLLHEDEKLSSTNLLNILEVARGRAEI